VSRVELVRGLADPARGLKGVAFLAPAPFVGMLRRIFDGEVIPRGEFENLLAAIREQRVVMISGLDLAE